MDIHFSLEPTREEMEFIQGVLKKGGGLLFKVKNNKAAGLRVLQGEAMDLTEYFLKTMLDDK